MELFSFLFSSSGVMKILNSKIGTFWLGLKLIEFEELVSSNVVLSYFLITKMSTMLKTSKRMLLSKAIGNNRQSFRLLSQKSTIETPFNKILIANRGEIACRIIQSAKNLGIKTVAIYSEPDSKSKHVQMADESYCVGGAQSKESYLNMKKIIEIAKFSNSQAIHPGYGFLSENASFVDLVEASGIEFIGPSSISMNQMGDKINSKKVAKNAGCFIIPGYDGEVKDEDAASKIAAEVGYPVMIKASAGGGGKGMRIAYNDQEVREGFKLSKAEALSSFGDDRMLIERYIEEPHHIEIQVLADKFGNVVAFPERECSVQRRNQKVVEESPSCLLTPETRRKMQKQAIALCLATGYRSAGTVEMLADNKQNFYFLEMNTRLQVEHPITELVSGEDLVAHMLWIASGKVLPSKLLNEGKSGFLSPKGWAIESRIYAEDPLRNFLPSIGPLVSYKEPVRKTSEINDNGESITVRVDTGVREGDSISMYYDPMIAKLCTHASTRKGAIVAMERALDEYFISGLVNNIPFVRSIFRNETFRSGKYGTSFIGQQYPNGFKGLELSESEMFELVGLVTAIHQARKSIKIQDSMSNEINDYEEENSKEEIVLCISDNNHSTKPLTQTFKVTSSFEDDVLDVEFVDIKANSKVQNILVTALDWQCDTPLGSVSFAESSDKLFQFEGKGSQVSGSQGGVGEVLFLRYLGSQKRVEIRTPLEQSLANYTLPVEVKDQSNFLLCPMPGTLISCNIKVGQEIEQGQQLAVVEAMKMQNVLRAHRKGIVKKVNAIVGSHLKVDQVIIEYEPESSKKVD